jgi:hypothetical protein
MFDFTLNLAIAASLSTDFPPLALTEEPLFWNKFNSNDLEFKDARWMNAPHPKI